MLDHKQSFVKLNKEYMHYIIEITLHTQHNTQYSISKQLTIYWPLIIVHCLKSIARYNQLNKEINGNIKSIIAIAAMPQ